MAVFSIPGNIKQMYLPFVLDPNNPLNKRNKVEARYVSGYPQIFSFRESSLNQFKDASVAKINICPTSFFNEMSQDISYQLLYENQASKSSINVNTIFDAIPGIQIREFLPDTRLDQALDFFSKVMSAVYSAFKKDKETQEGQNEEQKTQMDESIIQKITRTCKFAVKYLTGFSNPNLYTDAFKNVGNSNLLNAGNEELDIYIHKFPYAMWYQLQSCTTTNIYELPCITDSKEMYSSDGNHGWPSAGLSLTNDFLTNIPLVGSLVKSLLGNVNISFMPWWDAKEGNATPTPPVTVKFDLFNDTAENAVINFVFVNTLVPNAKWVQYNLFQHSPHLYDIKLEGYGRLFACSGSFKVTHRGVLREMPDVWIEKYLGKRINECMNKDLFKEALKKGKLVKIPDIYHVEMTFNSLLPDTFNNYLYTYSQNSNIITTYNNKVRQESVAVTALTDGITSLKDNVVKVWNGEMSADD